MRATTPSLLALAIAALPFTACGRVPLDSGDTSVADARVAGAGGAGGHAGTTGLAGSGGRAGGTGGAAGSPGAAGVSGVGGMSGVCVPGTSRCDEQGFVNVCLSDGTLAVQWLCDKGCLNGVCVECRAGDAQCASEKELRTCVDGRWDAPSLCANGCSAGACANVCTSGRTRCLNQMQMQVCGADGLWGVAQACRLCMNDTCIVPATECEPGTSFCASPTQVQVCNSAGTWHDPVTCDHGCQDSNCLACEPFTSICVGDATGQTCEPGGVYGPLFFCAQQCRNGLCTDCSPGESACLDDKNLRTCNDHGAWDPAVACDGACLDNVCHSCKPGQTQCVSDNQFQLCSAEGEWGDSLACASPCVDNSCRTNPKKVFVTSTIYVGGKLGGLAGADAKCQARANVAGLTGTFRAWLSDATGSPASRFKQDGGPYELVDGSIVADNWSALTSLNLRHGIDLTEFGGGPPQGTATECGPVVWTDTNVDGNLADEALSCGSWNDVNATSTWWGNPTDTGSWTSYCDGSLNPGACATANALYCFEQ